MNPFLVSPRERLALWKSLRASLVNLPEDQQLQTVAKFWAQAPVHKFAYDVERPDTWPTPWEMVSDGDWCVRSVGIGMEFTLRLGGWDTERLRMKLIRDYDIPDILFVVEIDQKFYLNYDHGNVVSIPKTKRDVLCSWKYTKRGFENS